MLKKKHSKKLDRLYRHFSKAAKEMAGYPLCQEFDYSGLSRFLDFHINNLGDPFLKSWPYRINTLKFEKEVIDRIAKLLSASEGAYWGYVTTGGTEGNLYGLYMARELYPKGMIFYSDQTHYSVPKCVRLLRMHQSMIGSLPNGEIDYEELEKALHREKKTPIIFANIGTTMKGAVDNLTRIKKILAKLKIKEYYIHCDAAFFGLILPFLPELESQTFDFRMNVDSIAISGHKMIGTPFSCGAVLTKKSDLDRISSYIEYTASRDNTITGSRNGFAPLFLWQELVCAEKNKLKKLARSCIDKSDYAIKKFKDHGIDAWRNDNSVIVVFPKPSDKMIRKWQLAAQGDISHLIVLPHVSHKMIDRFIAEAAVDLKRRRKKHNCKAT